MRTATQDTALIVQDGETLGVALGFDHCAEHENGMKELKAFFGLDSKARGLDRFRIRKVPEKLQWVEMKGTYQPEITASVRKLPPRHEVVLEGFGFSRYRESPIPSFLDGIDTFYARTLSAGWASDEFLVLSWHSETIAALWKLFERIQRKEAALTQGGPSAGNPFGGSGPCFVRTDTHPEMWANLDAQLRLEQDAHDKWTAEWAAECVGIYEALTEMSLKVSALCHDGWVERIPWIYLPIPKADGAWAHSPDSRWGDREPKRVWLNPWRQELWSAGYFTSTELRGWAVGDGKVWPLGVALPGQEHPVWEYLQGKAPAPTKGRDHWIFPFHYDYDDRQTPSADGWGFWHYVTPICGISIGEYGQRGIHHPLFRKDVEAAAKEGLTTLAYVEKLDVFETFVRQWNEEHPSDPLPYQLYGRGSKSLKAKLGVL